MGYIGYVVEEGIPGFFPTSLPAATSRGKRKRLLASSGGYLPLNRETTNATFCPPSPKLLFRMCLQAACRATLGT